MSPRLIVKYAHLWNIDTSGHVEIADILLNILNRLADIFI